MNPMSNYLASERLKLSSLVISGIWPDLTYKYLACVWVLAGKLTTGLSSTIIVLQQESNYAEHFDAAA